MAQEKPRVLIVDDETTSLEIFQHLLGDQFAFDHAPTGESALKAALKGKPAIILMDVEMPGGMDGYQACRVLKERAELQHAPVIFMSAHSQTEDRLKAYACGGDDYVSKPVNHQELRHKLTLALAHQRRRAELAEKARAATNVAMLSMREAADASVVLQFLSLIFQQTSPDEIAASVLQTLHKFHIRGAVQLREGIHRVSRNSDGALSPVEDDVLTKMATGRRIVDMGARSAFNYERATIIVYDMPLDDQALYGRLKDTVVRMAEGLDTHLRSLNTVNAVFNQAGRLRAKLAQAAEVSREAATRLAACLAAPNAVPSEPVKAAHDMVHGLSIEIEESLRHDAPIAPPVSSAPASNTELF